MEETASLPGPPHHRLPDEAVDEFFRPSRDADCWRGPGPKPGSALPHQGLSHRNRDPPAGGPPQKKAAARGRRRRDQAGCGFGTARWWPLLKSAPPGLRPVGHFLTRSGAAIPEIKRWCCPPGPWSGASAAGRALQRVGAPTSSFGQEHFAGSAWGFPNFTDMGDHGVKPSPGGAARSPALSTFRRAFSGLGTCSCSCSAARELCVALAEGFAECTGGRSVEPRCNHRNDKPVQLAFRNLDDRTPRRIRTRRLRGAVRALPHAADPPTIEAWRTEKRVDRKPAHGHLKRAIEDALVALRGVRAISTRLEALSAASSTRSSGDAMLATASASITRRPRPCQAALPAHPDERNYEETIVTVTFDQRGSPPQRRCSTTSVPLAPDGSSPAAFAALGACPRAGESRTRGMIGSNCFLGRDAA